MKGHDVVISEAPAPPGVTGAEVAARFRARFLKLLRRRIAWLQRVEQHPSGVTGAEVEARLRARVLERLKRRIGHLRVPVHPPYFNVWSRDDRPRQVDVRSLPVIDARGDVLRVWDHDQCFFESWLWCYGYESTGAITVSACEGAGRTAVVVQCAPEPLLVLRVERPPRFYVDPWQVLGGPLPEEAPAAAQWWARVEELYATATRVLEAHYTDPPFPDLFAFEPTERLPEPESAPVLGPRTQAQDLLWGGRSSFSGNPETFEAEVDAFLKRMGAYLEKHLDTVLERFSPEWQAANTVEIIDLGERRRLRERDADPDPDLDDDNDD